MTQGTMPFTDCRLMTALKIAARFSADYGIWLISEVRRDRPSFTPGPEQDGDPLDQFDGSVIYGVTARLTYFLQHIPIVYESEVDRDELIELLQAVLEQMNELRADRSRRGLLRTAWAISSREIGRAIDALRRNEHMICVHTVYDGAESATQPSESPGITDGDGI